MQERKTKSLANAILSDLSSFADWHSGAYVNVYSAINRVNVFKKQFKRGLSSADPEYYIQQMQLEKAVAFALLSLYKKPIPPASSILLFGEHMKEAEIIRNKVEEIIKTYFLGMMQECKDKLEPELVINTLVSKVKNAQHLTQLLGTPETSVNTVKGFNDIAAWKTKADFTDNLQWTAYNSNLAGLAINLEIQASKSKTHTKFVIKECYMDASELSKAHEHRFHAQEEPVSIESILVPAVGLLVVALAALDHKGEVSGEGVKVFSAALDNALRMKKNNENTVWETNVKIPKENVVSVTDAKTGKPIIAKNESFDKYFIKVFNLSIEKGLNESSAVWHAYFIEPDDQSDTVQDRDDTTNKVFVYTADQASKLVDYVNSHPLWFDQDKGWRLSNYIDSLQFKEKLINSLCDTLDELNKQANPVIQAALAQELSHFRRQQSLDMSVVCKKFSRTERYCNNIIYLGNESGKHPLTNCLARAADQLQWMRDVVAKIDTNGLMGSENFQDNAAIATREFQPGRLIKKIGKIPVTKQNLEQAYISFLKDYIKGEMRDDVFLKIREEYEFMSNPLYRKAWNEKPKDVLKGKKQMELGDANEEESNYHVGNKRK
jgi:hypothetical protein